MNSARGVARAVVVAAVCVFLVSAASAAVNIETVTVGDPGNVADMRYNLHVRPEGFGAVPYTYNIGKYEVTAGQYTAFLNAVAKTDTYGLYWWPMSHPVAGCGITQNGSSGSYAYSVAPDFINRPQNYVTFWAACRFANWLHNGQPTGAQGAGTTETGAYTLTPTGMDNNTITRNPGATWAVTSDDEWYKAAYYNPATGTYFDYPTSSNTAPGQDMADVSGNNANYYTPPYTYPIDSPYYTTVVGQFQNSASPYGTFDQGGNVLEWTDTIFGVHRGARGGANAWNISIINAQFSNYGGIPTYGDSVFGFRVSQPIPEPAKLPPVADANGPYVAHATSWAGASLSLDGTASCDPDYPGDAGAITAYRWDLDLAVDSDGDGDPTNDVDFCGPTPTAEFPIGQTEIALVVVDKDGLSSQPTVTTVTVSTLHVKVDIKPGSDQNTINLGSSGVVPVAFLTTPDFDASTINPRTVTLRGGDFSDGLVKLRGKKDAVPMATLVDVDGDGHLDLLVQLDTERLAEYELTAVCEFGALTYDGYVVSGSDTIRVVPAK